MKDEKGLVQLFSKGTPQGGLSPATRSRSPKEAASLGEDRQLTRHTFIWMRH